MGAQGWERGTKSAGGGGWTGGLLGRCGSEWGMIGVPKGGQTFNIKDHPSQHEFVSSI